MKKTTDIATVTLLILSILFVLFVAVKIFWASENKPTSEVGRYQLFQGTYTALDFLNNRADKEIAIFLLDTSTGRVKRYDTGLNKAKEIYERWVPTEIDISK